ncbi:hypothetical protein ACWEQL_00890 [Kitasatospora sp. NPDC004240]
MAMRVVLSPTRPSELADAAQIGALTAAVDVALQRPKRSSLTRGDGRVVTAACSLAAYPAPDGGHRWAVRTVSDDGVEYLDAADRGPAEEEYERRVRELAGRGTPELPWWGESDVPGVAVGSFTYAVEFSEDDGDTWVLDIRSTDYLVERPFAREAECLLAEHAVGAALEGRRRTWRVRLWAGTPPPADPPDSSSAMLPAGPPTAEVCRMIADLGDLPLM